jgi:hypothetical protein
MATCRFIVNSALQKLGVLGAGREARTADATDALAALQGLYGSWIASGAFGRLEDITPIGDTFTASGNQRIIRTGPSLEVLLPEYVADGWVNDYGNERRGYYGTTVKITTQGDNIIVDVEGTQPMACAVPPRDGSVVIITDREGGQTATWLYEGTLKAWQGVERLTLEDEAPRSFADPQGLAAMVALEIADAYGDAGTLGPSTQMQAARYRQALTTRFGMRRETIMGMYY